MPQDGMPKRDMPYDCMPKYRTAVSTTVLAPIEPRGSIFQNEFLGGVQFIFDLPGVVIKMGFY